MDNTTIKKKKNKIKVHQIARNIIQLVSFLLLPGLFIDSFNGIKALVQGIVKSDMSGVAVALIPTILLIAATIVFGRFFCGFLCSFGTMTDAVHFVGRKLFKIKFKMPEKADKILKYLKYVIFAVILIIWISGINILESISPWNSFGALLSFTPDFSYAFSSVIIGTILLIFIIIGSLFIERFFCRYFCPMGAVFALVSHLRIAKIKKPRQNCGKCKLCTTKCKMGIPLYETDSVNSGECIDCMQCTSDCPQQNAHLTIVEKDVVPLTASVLAASTIGLYYIGNIGFNAFNANSSSSSTVSSSVSSNKYSDGTFEGSGTGFHNGITTVSVTIQNGKITNITTVSTQDTDSYYNRAFSSISSSIISAQDSSVNTVSGATFSSRGIMEAVSNALSKAENNSGELSSQTSVSNNTSNDNESSNSEIIQAESSSQSETQSSVEESSSEESTVENGNTQTQESSIQNDNTQSQTSSDESTAQTSSSSAYIDGTYQGSGTGFNGGTTTVSVTIANGKITDIETISQNDQPHHGQDFYNTAFPTIKSEILASQTSSVDAVSGATFSSRGIMGAVEDALSKAKG